MVEPWRGWLGEGEATGGMAISLFLILVEVSDAIAVAIRCFSYHR
jgi:hypothetical protein